MIDTPGSHPRNSMKVVQGGDRRSNRCDRRQQYGGRRASDFSPPAPWRNYHWPQHRGPYSLNEPKKEVFYKNTQVSLTRKEYELFRLLFSEPEQVFSTHQIAAALWQGRPEDYLDAKEREIKQLIYTIRKKLKTISDGAEQIENVRGFGYRLNP